MYASVRRVAAAGCAVLFVSHRLGEVLALCDTVTVMRDGEVVATAAGELTMDSLIHHMLGDPPHRAAGPPARSSGEVVLSVAGLRVPGRVQAFSLACGPVRCALSPASSAPAPPTSCAPSPVWCPLHGARQVDGADVPVGRPLAAVDAGIAFVSNDRKSEGLFLDKPVSWNLLATRLPSSPVGVVSRRRWTASLDRFGLCGLDRKRVGQAVGELSGGNQQKVFVGRCLGRDDVRVLLLDDPTRGVDVGGRAAIHPLMRDAAEAGWRCSSAPQSSRSCATWPTSSSRCTRAPRCGGTRAASAARSCCGR